MLARLDRNKELALLCVNDEIKKDHAGVTALFREWQDKRWGAPAAWEADLNVGRSTGNQRQRRAEVGEEEEEEGGAKAFRIRGSEPLGSS